MGEAIITDLQSFLLELPDADQELAVQALGKVLQEFTLFPKLPLEIRLMVWRLTFLRARKLRVRRSQE
jgi:hypothetical protein